jgi:hypothetical protein
MFKGNPHKGWFDITLQFNNLLFKNSNGLNKKLSQVMDCPLPTNNTYTIMSTKLAHTQIYKIIVNTT